jgi:hypothetical protein
MSRALVWSHWELKLQGSTSPTPLSVIPRISYGNVYFSSVLYAWTLFNICLMIFYQFMRLYRDRLRGLVGRVSGYRSRGPGLDSRPHQILKTEINGRGNSLRRPCNTLYPQKLALTSPTSGGRSVGIVRLRTKATEFSFSLWGYIDSVITIIIVFVVIIIIITIITINQLVCLLTRLGFSSLQTVIFDFLL